MKEGVAVAKSRRDHVLAIIACILLSLAIAACLFFYLQYQSLRQVTGGDQQHILQNIASVMVLPEEKPTTFTVADKSRLNNIALAGKVEDGDTLFIYSDAQKLLVYRPSIKKIVDVLSIQ